MAACEEGVRLPPAVANIAHILLVISFHNELRKTTGGVSDPPAVANIAHILLVISFHNKLRKTTGGV